MDQPTNSDLLKELKSIHSVLKDHEERLRLLERANMMKEAAEAAIASYRREQAETTQGSGVVKSNFLGDGVNKDFIRVVLTFLGVITSLLAIFSLILQYFLK